VCLKLSNKIDFVIPNKVSFFISDTSASIKLAVFAIFPLEPSLPVSDFLADERQRSNLASSELFIAKIVLQQSSNLRCRFSPPSSLETQEIRQLKQKKIYDQAGFNLKQFDATVNFFTTSMAARSSLLGSLQLQDCR
jgi:hypothetical protein